MATRPISVRVTDEEYGRYRKAAGTKPLSVWLRELADQAAPPAHPERLERCDPDTSRHTGPYQQLGYMTRCQGCGQAVR